jgi:rRNA maturation endonuclease Nob1
MDTYRIECQECEEVSHITSSAEPEFCPLCGRRPGVVDLSKDLDAFNDNYD